MPAADVLEIWSPMYLERLARTYWKYLSRVTLGLIRVEYTATERAVVLLHRPLVLLRFKAPDYTLSDGRGIGDHRVRDVLLLGPVEQLQSAALTASSKESGRSLMPAGGRVSTTVSDFMPSTSGRTSPVSTGVTSDTQ